MKFYAIFSLYSCFVYIVLNISGNVDFEASHYPNVSSFFSSLNTNWIESAAHASKMTHGVSAETSCLSLLSEKITVK